MRALRWPDAFPDGDLGLLKASGERSGHALLRDRRIVAAVAGLRRDVPVGKLARSTEHFTKDRMNSMSDVIHYTYCTSPIGKFLVTSDGEALTGHIFPGPPGTPRAPARLASRRRRRFGRGRAAVAGVLCGQAANVRRSVAAGGHAFRAPRVERAPPHSFRHDRRLSRHCPANRPTNGLPRWAWPTGAIRSRSSFPATA